MNQNGILIIGGTGFIGSALVKRLQLQNKRPIHVLARHAEKSTLNNVVSHRGSIDDTALIRQILPYCSTVIHAASTTTPGVSAQQPSLEATQNILPTLRFLELLSEFPPRQLLYISSGGTFYGHPETNPVTEGSIFSPQSYYGAGKVAVEAFLKAYQYQTGSSVISLRPSNVYGDGQPFRQGFGLIRTMFEHVLNRTSLEIWGDGGIIRDFIYIDDVVDVCIALLDKHKISGSYNVGFGEGYSINGVLSLLETVCETTVSKTYLPARQIDVQSIVLNTQSLRELLQWEPKIALEHGLKLTWQWLTHHSQK
jgi:UDP-glucose 4-epimerase